MAVDDKTEPQSPTGPETDVEDRTEQVAVPPEPTREGTVLQGEAEVEAAERLSQGKPVVPGYEVKEKLGQGSYGEVWRALEHRTGIEVAIKFLIHGGGLEWQLLQAEVKQLALLHSDPGIVQLLDVEPEAKPPYYVMEFVRQGSLARKLEKGPIPVAEALEIFRHMAEALAYVHAKGVRHCDLKPGNILLDARGRARIADFGQAHLSSDASPALGTFFYMAPEQANLQNQIPDTRWDVYGLGALLYTMVTGRPPREHADVRDKLAQTEALPSRLEIYRDWVETAPPPQAHRQVAGMDRNLADIIDRCLEIDPKKRLMDAGAILGALARRERLHRQRPLLVFGAIAPAVLLLAMALLGSFILNTAIDKSEATLTAELNSLLESDLVSARLIAKAVEDQMQSIEIRAEYRAADADLRRALKNKDRDKLTGLLHKFFKSQRKGDISHWALSDRHGNLLSIIPMEKSVLDKNFAWRDWFNGTGDHTTDKKKLYEPIRKTHIAQPFVGKTSDRPRIITVSTPVMDPDDPNQVAGVLLAAIKLEDFYGWLHQATTFKHGFVVLINEHGQYILHKNLEAITPKYLVAPPRFSNEVFQEVLAGKEGSKTYKDPIDHKTYLAGFAPLRSIGWGALVQHDRRSALQPIGKLKRDLARNFWIAMISAGVLISALWGGLLWTLRRSARREGI
jgi:serine/threonine protein kinase